jgi:UDP-N-acetylmuramoylalanine--D-glutamate ligase
MKLLLIYGKGKTGSAVKRLADHYGIENILVDDTDFKEELLDKTDLIVVSPGIPFYHKIYKLARKRKIPIEGEIEFANRFFKGEILAVTGTDGKSTTTKMIHHLIGEDKISIGGNYGIPFSEVVLENPEKDVVLELSSFQIYSTKKLKPKIGVLLNISVDHLDWHKKFCHYKLSKYKLFKNMTEDDFAVINLDDRNIDDFPTGAKKVYFSLSELPKNLEGAYLKEGKAIIRINSKEIDINLPKNIKGIHNIQNMLAASLTAYLYGTDPKQIEDRLKTFEPLPFRMEFIGEINEIKFFNDAKSTTVQSLEMALKSFDSKELIVIAGGINKGGDFSKLKDILKKRVKKVILIGRDKDQIAEMIEGATDIEKKDSLKEAVVEAFKSAEKGDTILFSPACASFDMFKNYIDRGEQFNKIFNELKNA